MVGRAGSIAAMAFLFVSSVAGAARANEGINGYSGKPIFGVADTCDTNCHKSSGAIPTITLTIPTTVQAGSTNDVTLVVNGTRVRTSFDAAFTDGVVVTAGMNTTVPFPVENPEEVVAKTPLPAGASGTYKFSFTAPKTNGTLTLWVAAMSASGAGTANDGVAKTTRTITVTGGTAPVPDAGTTSSSGSPSSSSGAPSSSSGGTSTSGGPFGDDGGGGTTSSSGGAGASGRRLPASDDGGGCNVASPSRRAPWSYAFLTALVIAARGRARRRLRERGRS